MAAARRLLLVVALSSLWSSFALPCATEPATHLLALDLKAEVHEPLGHSDSALVGIEFYDEQGREDHFYGGNCQYYAYVPSKGGGAVSTVSIELIQKEGCKVSVRNAERSHSQTRALSLSQFTHGTHTPLSSLSLTNQHQHHGRRLRESGGVYCIIFAYSNEPVFIPMNAEQTTQRTTEPSTLYPRPDN